jgi:hypothetical protein
MAPAGVGHVAVRPLGQVAADEADDFPLEVLVLGRLALEHGEDAAAGLVADRLRLAVAGEAGGAAVIAVQPAAQIGGGQVDEAAEDRPGRLFELLLRHAAAAPLLRVVAGGCGLLRDIFRLGGELPPSLEVAPLGGGGALILLGREALARRLREIALAGLERFLAGLRAPFLLGPLGEVVVGLLRAFVVAAAFLVFGARHLRLAGGPLAGLAALVASGDLVLHLLPKFGIGLARGACHVALPSTWLHPATSRHGKRSHARRIAHARVNRAGSGFGAQQQRGGERLVSGEHRQRPVAGEVGAVRRIRHMLTGSRQRTLLPAGAKTCRLRDQAPSAARCRRRSGGGFPPRRPSRRNACRVPHRPARRRPARRLPAPHGERARIASEERARGSAPRAAGRRKKMPAEAEGKGLLRRIRHAS